MARTAAFRRKRKKLRKRKPRKPKPHDSLFKAAFAAPEHAAALFRESLEPSISAAIEWDTLTPEPGSYIDTDLSDSHSDLLFSVQLNGTQAWLYMLLEHQSTNHAYMPLRMLHYSVQVWLRHCKHDGRSANSYRKPSKLP